MAVYTPVSADDLLKFLQAYELGEVRAFKGIAEGIENTNYFLETDQGRYILTLFEARVAEQDLPFFMALMSDFGKTNLPSAAPVADKDGVVLKRLNRRPAVIIDFVDGLSVDQPTPDHCAALGEMLAQMHLATQKLDLSRDNSLSVLGWRDLARSCGDLDQVSAGLQAQVDDHLGAVEAWPTPAALPRGVIHADLFPDNVLFSGPDITGLIDFYFACTDFYAYDLAICLNAWGFDPAHKYNQENAAALLGAYHAVRPLSEAEQTALPLLARGAALRFLLTRAYDWLNQTAGALVTVKDPAEYVAKAAFHRDHNLLEGIDMRRKKGRKTPQLSPLVTSPETATIAVPPGIHIYTDGACSGNPGPGGWGVYMVMEGMESSRCGGEQNTTNNRMEMMAAIEALRALPDGTALTLYTDSKYLKDGLTKWIHGWKRNGWRTASKKPVKNQDLWEQLDQLAANRSITWQWVKGHAGVPGNEMADQLANQGLDRLR